jgi:hypothetical protein
MKHSWTTLAAITTLCLSVFDVQAHSGPFDGKTFKGRIAFSSDGNFNDEDDWGAFPVAAAILDAFGVTDKLVHVDYNNILPANDPRFYREMTESVLGAAERFNIPRSIMFDCQKDLDGAVESITRAINASSDDNPLYYVLAGPMEVPFRGIEKSDPAKRKYVYCISHSGWNDGYTRGEQNLHIHNKRDVIPSGINWIQVRDGNRELAHPGGVGKKSTPEQWKLYHWLRDSSDPRLRWIFTRLEAELRADISDSTMTYFLLTGVESANLTQVKSLLDEKNIPSIIEQREIVRIEAENFVTLTDYDVEHAHDRNASHRLSVKSTGGDSGWIETPLNQPYMADQGRYNIDIRYFDAKDNRSRISLFVNGRQQGDTCRTRGRGRSWTTFTVPDVSVRTGDLIAIETKADSGAPAKLDYVELAYLGADSEATVAASQELDDPEALPGQVIVAGARPGYLKYNGGGPAFLCGPDNPEDFLFRGELNADGTRSGGGQEEMIKRMVQAGVNAFHCQMFRMRVCNIKDEGDDTHGPFVDHDPSKPLDPELLDQWDRWLGLMEKSGIVVHLEFYNDATDVERMGWILDSDGNLHPHEQRFIEGVVKRFKHRKNILWGIQESCNKLPAERTPHFKKIAEVIAQADNHNHPIVQSFVVPNDPEGDFPEDGITSAPYLGDPNIRVVTWLHVPPHREDLRRQHAEYLHYRNRDAGNFVVMKNETYHHPRGHSLSRRYMWSCAMTGMHTLEAYHHADDSPDSILRDDGRINAFMELTNFHKMQPRDDLAAGSTMWVLASPGDSFIAYTYDYRGSMGLRNITSGTYDLLWYDTETGRTVRREGVFVSSGEAKWTKPESLGSEVALYISRN